MGKQVFIEGEILLTDQIATVNFSGHSRIMKQTLILPTRIDVTGSTRLHFFCLGYYYQSGFKANGSQANIGVLLAAQLEIPRCCQSAM